MKKSVALSQPKIPSNCFVRATRVALAAVTISAVFFSCTLNAQYAPPAGGLVSWWRAGNNANDSVGVNNGVGINGLGYAPGISGAAFSLDGIDDHVRVTASPSLNVGLGNGFTIGSWIKPTTLAQQDLVEWNNNAGFIGVHMTLSVPNLGGGAGSLWANLVDAGGTAHALSTSPGLITTSAFQHVALTYDKIAGMAKLYLNGAVVASANVGSFTAYTSSDLYFGARPSGPFTGLQYAGLMDENTLYNRALSGSEVLTLATVPEPTTGALLLLSSLGFLLARRRSS